MNQIPYTFTEAYAGCYQVPSMAMDARHVFILHGILSAWPFWNALELGSFCGASSTAFIEAINGGSKMNATFCDTQVTKSLIDVVENSDDMERVRITPEPSCQVLDSAEVFDFVLVDANHDVASVAPEIERLLIRRPLCVMAHDTNATAAGYVKAEGALMLKRTFEMADDYLTIEDAVNRPGEETSRGLFFATTSPDLHRIAAEIFAKWKD